MFEKKIDFSPSFFLKIFQIKSRSKGSQNIRERTNFARTIMIFFAATLISLSPYTIYQFIRLFEVKLDHRECLSIKK